MKLTAAAGYMRVEAETIALLLLFQGKPAGLAYFLRMQERILDLLPTVFAGLRDDQEFKGALAAFISLEDKTWWVMERKYEKEIQEFYVPSARPLDYM